MHPSLGRADLTSGIDDRRHRPAIALESRRMRWPVLQQPVEDQFVKHPLLAVAVVGYQVRLQPRVPLAFETATILVFDIQMAENAHFRSIATPSWSRLLGHGSFQTLMIDMLDESQERAGLAFTTVIASAVAVSRGDGGVRVALTRRRTCLGRVRPAQSLSSMIHWHYIHLFMIWYLYGRAGPARSLLWIATTTYVTNFCSVRYDTTVVI